MIDRLVYPILLGFIQLNQLIIDVETETFTDKCYRYDIMIVNCKTTALGTKEVTDALLEQK